MLTQKYTKRLPLEECVKRIRERFKQFDNPAPPEPKPGAVFGRAGEKWMEGME